MFHCLCGPGADICAGRRLERAHARYMHLHMYVHMLHCREKEFKYMHINMHIILNKLLAAALDPDYFWNVFLET